MLALSSTALLVAVALMVPATVLVLTVPARRRRPPLPTTLTSASVAGVVVGAAGLALGAVLGAGAPRSLAVAVLLGASVVAWAPVAREWDLRGLVAWALGVDVAAGFLAYVAAWILAAGLGTWAMLAGAVLVLLEALVLMVGLGYLRDFVDVLSRRHRHRGPKHDGWARPAGHGALVVAAAAVAVGGFVAFASPTGGPDVAELTRQATGETPTTQATVLGGGQPLAPLSSADRSVGGVPTAVRLGTTALPTLSSSVVRPPTSTASSAGPPGSSAGPPSPSAHPSSTQPSSSPPTRAPSSSPTGTSSAPGPSSAPTSTPPTSDPTSAPPTHTHPTHPSHPPHSSHPTHSTGRPTPSGGPCGTGC